MAISGKLYKLAWGGSMFTTEQWVNSIHVNAPDVLPQDPEAYLAAVIGIMNSNQLKMNTGALLEYIKFNEINPATGLYADQTASHTFFLPIPAQGMGSPAGPAQIALCVGLTTPATRGFAHAGRFFLPVSALPFGSDGRLSQSTADNAADDVKAFVNAVNGVNDDGDVCVFSQTGQVLRLVTGVRVGRVLDTQRRRRTSLPESPSLRQLL
jgi:hypothetical protein